MFFTGIGTGALQGAARLGKTINRIFISRAAAPATEVEATPVNLALRVSMGAFAGESYEK